jgi:hypothetical protein
MDFVSAQAVLVTAGVEIDTGLTSEEFTSIEARFRFQFPDDLREFLSIGLPISRGWIDWRHAEEKTIRERMGWPFEGMCFDISNNAFWLEEWGRRPSDLKDAIEIARQAYQQAPVLIPIHSHRYIPTLPREPGNPIFSVYQTDIIYYGSDLMDYLQNEFLYHFGRSTYTITGTPRQIPFWSALVG